MTTVSPELPAVSKLAVTDILESISTFTETESLHAQAVVVDESGVLVENHETNNPQVLINQNIMTAQQLITVQDWIRTIRDNAEATLLPAP